ncbi:MAG: damage-inducible protein DinB, partial [Thermodesulfobacteriota bacterium]
MLYAHLVDTYQTERLKTLSVWSMFEDDDLATRPSPLNERDRNPCEHMIHQCMGENKWFCEMLGIDVGAPPLPSEETR